MMSYMEYANKFRKLTLDGMLGFDMPIISLSVESKLANTIRWHKSKNHNIPFVWLRRQSIVYDTHAKVNPLSDTNPIYRLDGVKITDPLEYDLVSCGRALFDDIDELIKKTKNPRYGVFEDAAFASRNVSDWFDYTDGGLFLTWVNFDEYSQVRCVQCNVFIAGEK